MSVFGIPRSQCHCSCHRAPAGVKVSHVIACCYDDQFFTVDHEDIINEARKEGEKEMSNTETKMPVVGEPVTYTNPVGKRFNALVTAVWGPNCINLVYVTDDENQTDNYGRKLAREASLMRKSGDSAHGQFWEN